MTFRSVTRSNVPTASWAGPGCSSLPPTVCATSPSQHSYPFSRKRFAICSEVSDVVTAPQSGRSWSVTSPTPAPMSRATSKRGGAPASASSTDSCCVESRWSGSAAARPVRGSGVGWGGWARGWVGGWRTGVEQAVDVKVRAEAAQHAVQARPQPRQPVCGHRLLQELVRRGVPLQLHEGDFAAPLLRPAEPVAEGGRRLGRRAHGEHGAAEASLRPPPPARKNGNRLFNFRTNGKPHFQN